MAWGCREAGNVHAPRVPLRRWKPPRREREGRHTVCVCVFHTARRRLWSVCVQLVGTGEGASPARDTAQTGGGPPHAQRRVRATAGLRRARALEPKRCASQRNRKFADGGITSGRKSSNWSSRAKPTKPEACVSTGARAPRAGASAQRRTRPVKTKKKKGGRPKGTDSRGGAPDARRKPTLPTLFKTTRRPQSPRRRACCKVFRLRRRGGRWVGEMGRALERALRRRPPPSRGAGRARAARSSLCRPPPG